MKKLYLIGGTMGVGKTATCQALKKQLDKAVFLDGDWCWDASPFIVSEETKKMVLANICYLLNNFLKCSAYENIIFCWVMHDQTIIDDILNNLDCSDCDVKCISLICTPQALKTRLMNDVEKGLRTIDIVDKSIQRLPLFDNLNTIKIDVSQISIFETASLIQSL